MQATRLCITAKPLLKGHSVYSTAAGFNFLHNQRFFSFSAQRFNEEETPKTPEADVAEPAEEVEPIKLSRRRRRFHEWMKETGHKFSRPSKGTTNYLAATPFPNNPLFQPRPPLSDATKQEIYEAFVSDSENWTGVALQKKFAKGMEQLMGVDKTIELLKEPLADVFPNVGKPKFKTLKEDATFGPKDAAKVLNIMPYKDLEKRAIEREQAEFTLPKPNTAEQTAKHTKKFVIVDTSS
ncbi:hypothetical protein RO3G_07602 [Rhizopus delemar RA 99-880]|uniref:Uncharacterized protein n=1 Tax=Rhizopus delemar (strain RA 99-880 / ATCC MYA-4621 / FGSC 9543 / NRRL 43880) TaxID=246409 RepID=I1C367_RHIO9|nr:hypothetical protein RO3G_07602 [Rhizopus delemar RA 99-880]|eukprot:EIE82897.1 hypothetical protein RO3G_07602 [Rhizopus delemar RA 99-880]